jgi:hypothetical protein
MRWKKCIVNRRRSSAKLYGSEAEAPTYFLEDEWVEFLDRSQLGTHRVNPVEEFVNTVNYIIQSVL